jgi:glycerophosphoryl diester phosphodiesterase
MQIIEQSSIPKSPDRKNEDGLVVTSDFIAVIDGSTSKTRHRVCPLMSNGRYAMRLISSYIRKMPANISCHQFCREVTAYIQRRYRYPILPFLTPESRIQRFREHPEERLTASAIVYSRVRREVWMIGDCQCLANGELYDNPKPYEQRLAELRAARVRELLSEGVTEEQQLENDPAREVVIAPLLETMHQQNKTFAVIDGFNIPQQLVPVYTLDFQPWELVFATDGYPFLCPTLAESEAKLDEQRQNDPLNIGQFKATKAFLKGNNSFDDRTYVRFMV